MYRTKEIKGVRFILDNDQPDESISKLFSHNWNQDHFGPDTVPHDHYFVLGDNRHASADSRYLGFIPEELCSNCALEEIN